MAAVLPAHDLERRARGIERAHQVHVDDTPHRLRRGLVEWAVIADAGVAHHHVEAAEGVDGAVDECGHVRFRRYVAGHRERFPARAPQVGHELLEPVRAPRRHDDCGAFGCRAPGGRLADSG